MDNRQVAVDAAAESAVVMQNVEWQQVLGILRKAPYEQVAPLIDKIISQCVQQAIRQPSHVTDRTTQG